MELAAWNSSRTTYASLPQVLDTLRLLTDSMDFSDENGNGWSALRSLCDSSVAVNGDSEAKRDLLLWMLKLSSFDLMTYVVRRHYASMLSYTLSPTHKQEEA